MLTRTGEIRLERSSPRPMGSQEGAARPAARRLQFGAVAASHASPRPAPLVVPGSRFQSNQPRFTSFPLVSDRPSGRVVVISQTSRGSCLPPSMSDRLCDRLQLRSIEPAVAHDSLLVVFEARWSIESGQVPPPPFAAAHHPGIWLRPQRWFPKGCPRRPYRLCPVFHSSRDLTIRGRADSPPFAAAALSIGLRTLPQVC
jgi:hypothetical protein